MAATLGAGEVSEATLGWALPRPKGAGGGRRVAGSVAGSAAGSAAPWRVPSLLLQPQAGASTVAPAS